MKFTMQDGRIFTDYNPNCELNNLIQKKYNVHDMTEYRHFLQNNAEKIIKDLSKFDMEPNCKFCPVCQAALSYKPKGALISSLE